MRFLIGPELIWLLVYASAAGIVRANSSSPKSMDGLILASYWWIPLLALLTFLLWWVPGVEKRWLLLRVWVVCVAVGMICLEKVMGAHSEGGAGIGTAYIVGVMLLFLALLAGTLLVKWRFS